ncbi:hypothetical protein V9K67_15120 [Paraflavisolibacter sp. H34]|uniref:hypothetical protein n=1 Tax=Huijunlia imazamoxiresistens TaxID=3127457 RepID=UPI00301672A4
MRKYLVAALLFLSCLPAFAQEVPAAVPVATATAAPVARTAFYAEVGGPGVLFSANIDHRLKNSHVGWGGRAGVGFITATEYHTNEYRSASVVTIPLQVNYVFGKAESPHTFEAGAGLTYIGKKLEFLDFYDDRSTQVLGTFCFMYRRQPVNGGFSWRVGFTPLVGKGYIQPLAAASVGYCL